MAGSGATHKAVEAAEANVGWLDHETPNIRMALDAAHNPALGSERSVRASEVLGRIGTVWDALRRSGAPAHQLAETRDQLREIERWAMGQEHEPPCEDCGGTGERIINPDWPSGAESYSEKCSTCGGGS